VGPANLGAYNFAYSVATYFMLPINVGLGATAMREIANDEGPAVQVISEVAVLQTVTTVLCFALLLVVSHLIVPSHEARALLPIAGVTILVQAVTFDWVVQARQRYSLVAAARLLGQVVFGIMVIALVGRGYSGTRWYAWANAIGVTVTAVVLVAALARTGMPRTRAVLRRARLLLRLRSSFSMATVLTLNQIYYSIDSTIIGYFRGTADVGLYGVAYKIPLAMIAFVNVWNNTLYTHAARLVKRDPDTLREQISLSMTVGLAFGLPTICGAAFLGDELLSELFGPQYGKAGAAFTILIGSMVVYTIWVNFSAISVAAERQRDYAWAVLWGTLFNVPVNIVVIPRFGIDGAASVTAITEMIITVYLWFSTRSIIGVTRLQLGRLGRVLLATAGMAAVLWATGSLEVFVRLVLGAATYLVLAAALRVVTPSELRRMRGRDPEAQAA
jgi:O-antigen/teichoic acid export membrane protein